MLECYLSDICKSISEHKSVTHQTYTLVPPIDNILQDCMGLCNITLQFYTQVKSALSLICKIFEETCDRLIKDLVLLLAKICEMIAKGEHFSHEISVPVRKNVGNDVEACLVELKIRVNRVTPRVINIWRNIVNCDKELEIVCLGFLKFFADIDPVIQKPGFEDPVVAMVKYTRNPGHVVQVVRKIQFYLDNELVSLRTVKDVYNMIVKTPPEVIMCVDKTLTGFVLWDFIRAALEYYRAYELFHYKIDIFDKRLITDKETENSTSRSLKDFTNSKLEIGSVLKATKLLKRTRTANFSTSQNFLKTENSTKKPNLLTYEHYLSQKFTKFLITKLKDSPKKLLNKSEVLNEFEYLIFQIEKETISQLWDPSNLKKVSQSLNPLPLNFLNN